MPITGIIPPLVTPFTGDDEFDEQGMRQQVRFMLDNGVHGVCVGGSTGEGYALSLAEFRRLVETTVDEVGGRVPVIAGIVTNSTRDALDRAAAIADLDIAALQVTPTYYIFRPSGEGMFEYFRSITETTGRPVIIYNVISWNMLSVDLLVRIMNEVPGVIGVKQSAGEIKTLADLLIMAPPGKIIVTAQDALLYATFSIGAQACISANPTAAPAACVSLWNAVKQGMHEDALRLHELLLRLWNAIGDDNMPACVKYALQVQGCAVGNPRAPLHPVSPAQKTRIEKAVADILAFRPALATHST